MIRKKPKSHYYSTGQVTEILNISRPTLYKLCKKKGINPKKTVGGNYRYTMADVNKLLDKQIDERCTEDKFINAVNDVWLIMKKLSDEIWGFEMGEKKLIDILQKNKNDIFILNITNFTN